MREAFRTRIARRLFGDVIAQEVTLAVKVVDDRWWQQIGGSRAGTVDRDWWEHAENLADALEAWRTNPLARQVVNLTTNYVVGRGVGVTSTKGYVDSWVRRFWRHRLNRMDLRLAGMCDELTRSGELFVVLSRNPADGMSYVRFVPASQIDQVETAEGDVERELRYHQVLAGEIGGRWWLSWDHPDAGAADQVMGHFAINRPVGATRGEGDLVPILPWLRRYNEWLYDRVKLNRYKSRFYWDVAIEGTEADIAAARARYATPPADGSIIVHSTKETWTAVQPKIEAEDAKEDGYVMRLMIAAGAGVPLHFMAEGLGATKATAVEMGDPTFRHYQRRQVYFAWVLREIVERAYEYAVQRGRVKSYGEDSGIDVRVTDVVEEDNLALAQSARTIVEAFGMMRDRGWISDEMAIRLAFKFAGEMLSEEEIAALVESGGSAAGGAGGGA